MNPIRKQFGTGNTRGPITAPPMGAVQGAVGGPQRTSGASSGRTVLDQDPMKPAGSPAQNVLKRKIGRG